MTLKYRPRPMHPMSHASVLGLLAVLFFLTGFGVFKLVKFRETGTKEAKIQNVTFEPSFEVRPALAGTVSSAPPKPASKLLQGSDFKEAQDRLEKLVSRVKSWGGRVGAVAVDVSSGAVLMAHDEHGIYVPASNAKLFTAAAALRTLGPQHRYLTGLYGVVSGNTVAELVLRGFGDPSLETEHLWEMARELRSQGIRNVTGITVDQGFFDDQYVPPGFEQQPNEWAPFRATVAAVSLNANTVVFSIRAEKLDDVATVTVEPPGFVELSGSVRTVKKDSPEQIFLQLEPLGERLSARLRGAIPSSSRLVRIAKRVDDPRLLAAYTLKQVLEETDIKVTGDLKLGGYRQKRLLVAHRSAPLGELLSAVGKNSDNFYAEMIFKTMGAEVRGTPGSAAAASEVVAEAVKELGAMEDGFVIKNGSGLFDADRTSPWSIAKLLEKAFYEPTLGHDFVTQLAIGGVDGTLRSRFRAWASRRAIRAKTGTLASVAALSGYILAPPGRSAIAFSILVNDIPKRVDAARKPMDGVVDALGRDLWKGSRLAN